jgi:hypothetical protein
MDTDPIFAMYFIFVSSAILCFIIHFVTSGLTAYGSLIAGYSVLFIAIIMLLVSVFSEMEDIDYINDNDYLIKYLNIFGFGIYMLMMFGTIGLKLYSLSVYKNRIISNEKYYFNFNIILFCLIFIQCIFIINNFYNISGIILSLLCLFGSITTITAILEFTTLSYFHADGFCSLCHT